MKNTTHTIFVYGTLKRGFPAYPHFLQDQKYLGHSRTEDGYCLYNLGWFPGMVRAAEGQVAGDLFEVSDARIEDLDMYECADSGIFERKEITLADGQTAIAYLYSGNPDVLTEESLIQDGVWRG